MATTLGEGSRAPLLVDAAAILSHDCARAKRFGVAVVVPTLVGHSEAEWIGRVRLTIRITTAQPNNSIERAAIRRRIVVAGALARGVVRACRACRGGAARQRDMSTADRCGCRTIGRARTRERRARRAAGRGRAGIRLCGEIRAADLSGAAPDRGPLRSARRSGRRRGHRVGPCVRRCIRSDSDRRVRRPAGSGVRRCVHPRIHDPRIGGLLVIRRGIGGKCCDVADIGLLAATLAVRRTCLGGCALRSIERICVGLRTIVRAISILAQSTQSATRPARDGDGERHHSCRGREAHLT